MAYLGAEEGEKDGAEDEAEVLRESEEDGVAEVCGVGGPEGGDLGWVDDVLYESQLGRMGRERGSSAEERGGDGG